MSQEEDNFFIKTRTIYRRLVGFNETDRFFDDNPDQKPAFEFWSLRHYLGGVAIGVLIPNRAKDFFIGSLIFEVAEEILARNIEEWKNASEPISNKVSDIIFNMLGYASGQLFVKVEK